MLPLRAFCAATLIVLAAGAAQAQAPAAEEQKPSMEATFPAGLGFATANRVLGSVTARF